MILMLLSAIATPVVFMLLTYWMDHKRPEPLFQLAKAVVLGGVVALLSLSFTAILNACKWIEVSDITSWNHFKQAFFGASLPEELSKLVMLWILLKNNKYFDEFLDGIVYAVFIAMGFAMVENVCYVLTNPAQWEAVIVGRSILSVPAHFCYAVVMGVCYSFWRFRRQKMFIYLAAIAPLFLHGVFDFCLNEVTPSTTSAYLIGIAIVFVVLVSLMCGFAYWGIVTTKNTDELIHKTIQQKLWKLSSVRTYIILGICLSSTLMINGEVPKGSNKANEVELSPQLGEFKDSFCLTIRKAYSQYESDRQPKVLLGNLMESLCDYDEKNYFTNQEFAMLKHCVRLDSFTEMKGQDDDVLHSVDGHVCYTPDRVNKAVLRLIDQTEVRAEKSDMMYEIIHTINKWSTDGSAAVAKLPCIKHLDRMLKAQTSVELTYSCYGKQELLLVSEFSGDLDMSLTDMTHCSTVNKQQKDGASWAVWTMEKQGDCKITITNPTDKDISFVLATIEWMN